MKKKVKLTISLIILIILVLATLIVVVDAKGKRRRNPCIGMFWGGVTCHTPCGAPAECHGVKPGLKGPGCDFGEICNNICQCTWADKDLDGFPITSCTSDNSKGWIVLETAEVVQGDKEWELSNPIGAQSFHLTQTKGADTTKIFKVNFYNKNQVVKTYDYSSEANGYFKLTRIKKLKIALQPPLAVTKVVVNWDDSGASNAAQPSFYIGAGKGTCDCNDYDPYTYPGAEEVCDNDDNDCDDIIDEDDVCEKNVYACKTDSFITDNKGDGNNLSYGRCAEGEWCSGTMIGESGSCTYYSTEEGGLGKKDFYTYICDRYTCYKFTTGSFMVCGTGWNCTAVCIPGECNYDSKEWCNNLGIWQVEGWCHSDCGKSDSTCEGNCEQSRCDVNTQKWCKNGYWVNEGYCNCDVCGNKDSSCTAKTKCACENGACDTENGAYCQNSIWKSENYCGTACCQKDYDCYLEDFCDTCTPGTCDLKNNKYCSGYVWVSENYCENCGKYDFDCGVEPCENGRCDINENKYCKNGEWVSLESEYCYPGYCGLQDPECECNNEKDDCCKGEDDLTCDPDCLENADLDCQDCTTASDDCCNDSPDSICDADCIPGVDPDCQSDCDIGSDDCCSDLDDDNCDTDCTENSDVDCVGVCTNDGGDCCVPDANGICDPDCVPSVDPDCAAHPCEENWVCNEWNVDCDGVNGEHTCLEWEDTNDCNTFFDKPDDTKPCYIDFPCTEDDDTDDDGYPERACYDTESDTILEELDCDDNEVSQNPNAKEICNGEDDNCDDSVDEGCPCMGGTTQNCGRDVGVCKTGLQLCIEGYWSICGGSGYMAPSKEACDDGLDNNCDSFIDENCKCVEGQKQDCGVEIGICKKGWQACYNGSFGSVCNDEVKGVTEVCNNNIDDDCDTTLDGDDSNCQVTTPVTTGAEHCKNRIQDAGEIGVDCGDSKDCPDCSEKSPACGYGKIEEKCTCGPAEYKTGYCCNGKYYLTQCAESAKDSDSDGCNDDKEFKLGTDPKSGDTDGDGLLDCDSTEQYPLCNEDGSCDVEREYPETLENCPPDCGKKGLGWLTWVILVLILLALVGIGFYLYAKSKGYKLSDLIKKILGKKKEEKSIFQLKFPFIHRAPTTLTSTSTGRNVIKLRTFVNESLKKGYTKLQIKQSALKAGWTEQEIDSILKGKKSGYKLFK